VVGCSLLLEVEVKNNKGNWEEWIEVEDLEPSAPNDRHYIFDPEKGEIVFGNGLNGLVPPKDSQIRASYQTTTGLKGNIPSKQKFSVFGGGISGENLCEAKGGTAPESIETAKKRAEHYFWSLCRAVTSEDYEQLAIATPGLRVARAKAIPQYSPRYPCFAMPGAVTVVVVPHVREGSDIHLPGEGFLQSVHRHLDMHRLITTDLHVVAPEYAKISVQAKVLLKKKSSREMVKNRIELALREFLDPMKGGPDKKGWPFGRPVYRSEIYQVIDQVDGVEYVTGVRMQAEGNGVRQATDEGKTDSPEEAIKISPVALVHSGQHRLEFIDAEALHGIGRVQDTDC